MEAKLTTEDFYLAAYLLCSDIPLLGHYREHNRSTFEFEGPQINQIVNDFYRDGVKISPRLYSIAIKNLKNLMYNGSKFQPTHINATETTRVQSRDST